jgi:RNA polymerase sigma factor (sigma-70 family)
MYKEKVLNDNLNDTEEETFSSSEFISTLNKLGEEIAGISDNELLTTKLKPLTMDEEQILFTGRLKCQEQIDKLNGNNPDQKAFLSNLKQDTEQVIAAYNMGLIRHCARKAIRKRSVEKRLFYKLLTPGLEGLYVAIEYFDPKQGKKFSTLGIKVIYQRMNDFIDFFERSIDITYAQNKKLIIMNKAKEEFIKTHHRIPTSKELINYTQRNYKGVGNKSLFLAALDTKRRIFLDDDYFSNTKSLPSMRKHEKITKPYKTPEQIIETTETNLWVLDFLNTLNKRDKNLIFSLWGIEDGVSKTQAAVAKDFDISSERVRQIEAEVYEEMRKAWLNKNPHFFNQRTSQSNPKTS